MGWESHPSPPSLCVQEDLTLPPLYPTPPPLAPPCAPVRASESVRPFALYYVGLELGWGWGACGLNRLYMLASLRSLCLRPSCKYMRARRLAPFRDPKISDRLAGLIEALLDAGGCDSRVHWPGQVGGGLLPHLLDPYFWVQVYCFGWFFNH